MMLEQLSNFFINTAHADTAVSPTPAQGGGFSFIFIFAIIIFVYLAIWRPQSKRAKEQQNLLNALAVGDEVVTAGGVLGRITKMNDQYLTLSINQDATIVIQKSAVANVLPKGTLKTLE